MNPQKLQALGELLQMKDTMSPEKQQALDELVQMAGGYRNIPGTVAYETLARRRAQGTPMEEESGGKQDSPFGIFPFLSPNTLESVVGPLQGQGRTDLLTVSGRSYRKQDAEDIFGPKTLAQMGSTRIEPAKRTYVTPDPTRGQAYLDALTGEGSSVVDKIAGHAGNIAAKSQNLPIIADVANLVQGGARILGVPTSPEEAEGLLELNEQLSQIEPDTLDYMLSAVPGLGPMLSNPQIRHLIGMMWEGDDHEREVAMQRLIEGGWLSPTATADFSEAVLPIIGPMLGRFGRGLRSYSREDQTETTGEMAGLLLPEVPKALRQASESVAAGRLAAADQNMAAAITGKPLLSKGRHVEDLRTLTEPTYVDHPGPGPATKTGPSVVRTAADELGWRMVSRDPESLSTKIQDIVEGGAKRDMDAIASRPSHQSTKVKMGSVENAIDAEIAQHAHPTLKQKVRLPDDTVVEVPKGKSPAQSDHIANLEIERWVLRNNQYLPDAWATRTRQAKAAKQAGGFDSATGTSREPLIGSEAYTFERLDHPLSRAIKQAEPDLVDPFRRYRAAQKIEPIIRKTFSDAGLPRTAARYLTLRLMRMMSGGTAGAGIGGAVGGPLGAGIGFLAAGALADTAPSLFKSTLSRTSRAYLNYKLGKLLKYTNDADVLAGLKNTARTAEVLSQVDEGVKAETGVPKRRPADAPYGFEADPAKSQLMRDLADAIKAERWELADNLVDEYTKIYGAEPPFNVGGPLPPDAPGGIRGLLPPGPDTPPLLPGSLHGPRPRGPGEGTLTGAHLGQRRLPPASEPVPDRVQWARQQQMRQQQAADEASSARLAEEGPYKLEGDVESYIASRERAWRAIADEGGIHAARFIAEHRDAAPANIGFPEAPPRPTVQPPTTALTEGSRTVVPETANFAAGTEGTVVRTWTTKYGKQMARIEFDEPVDGRSFTLVALDDAATLPEGSSVKPSALPTRESVATEAAAAATETPAAAVPAGLPTRTAVADSDLVGTAGPRASTKSKKMVNPIEEAEAGKPGQVVPRKMTPAEQAARDKVRANVEAKERSQRVGEAPPKVPKDFDGVLRDAMGDWVVYENGVAVDRAGSKGLAEVRHAARQAAKRKAADKAESPDLTAPDEIAAELETLRSMRAEVDRKRKEAALSGNRAEASRMHESMVGLDKSIAELEGKIGKSGVTKKRTPAGPNDSYAKSLVREMVQREMDPDTPIASMPDSELFYWAMELEDLPAASRAERAARRRDRHAIRIWLIEEGVYKVASESDLANTVVSGGGKKYEFKMGGKKYVYDDAAGNRLKGRGEKQGSSKKTIDLEDTTDVQLEQMAEAATRHSDLYTAAREELAKPRAWQQSSQSKQAVRAMQQDMNRLNKFINDPEWQELIASSTETGAEARTLHQKFLKAMEDGAERIKAGSATPPDSSKRRISSNELEGMKKFKPKDESASESIAALEKELEKAERQGQSFEKLAESESTPDSQARKFQKQAEDYYQQAADIEDQIEALKGSSTAKGKTFAEVRAEIEIKDKVQAKLDTLKKGQTVWVPIPGQALPVQGKISKLPKAADVIGVGEEVVVTVDGSNRKVALTYVQTTQPADFRPSMTKSEKSAASAAQYENFKKIPPTNKFAPLKSSEARGGLLSREDLAPNALVEGTIGTTYGANKQVRGRVVTGEVLISPKHGEYIEVYVTHEKVKGGRWKTVDEMKRSVKLSTLQKAQQ